MLMAENKILNLDDIKADFLTKDEVASILRTSVRTVERFIESGELIAVGVGLRHTVVQKTDFITFIENKRTKGKNN